MSSHATVSPVNATDLPAIDHGVSSVVVVLTGHRNDGGACRPAGRAWPCELVVAAR